MQMGSNRKIGHMNVDINYDEFILAYRSLIKSGADKDYYVLTTLKKYMLELKVEYKNQRPCLSVKYLGNNDLHAGQQHWNFFTQKINENVREVYNVEDSDEINLPISAANSDVFIEALKGLYSALKLDGIDPSRAYKAFAHPNQFMQTVLLLWTIVAVALSLCFTYYELFHLQWGSSLKLSNISFKEMLLSISLIFLRWSFPFLLEKQINPLALKLPKKSNRSASMRIYYFLIGLAPIFMTPFTL